MVREAILATDPGSNRMMSAGIMVDLLVERGLALHLAKRLYSQIRKGAPLHAEWRDAFADGRFHQRQGRAAMPDDLDADMANTADLKPSKAQEMAVPSRASARQCASNVSMAASMTYWLDPTFSEEGSEKDTLNLFNNAADVMGTHKDGVARGPFDGFAEVGATFDSAFLGLAPSPNRKRSAPDELAAPVSQQPRHGAGFGSSADELFDIAFGAFA